MTRTRKAALRGAIFVALSLFVACAMASSRPAPTPTPPERNVVIVVWDGLRPDAIDPADTPNLARLREAGAEFADHHSTYPTFTMMNSASFATGGFPGTTGYYGNVVWQPGAQGKDSAAKPVDFHQPVFSEDYAILDDLGRHLQGRLLLAPTLFEAAQKAGIQTFALGKNGAAYLQDAKRGGMVLDEKTVLPLWLAKDLQGLGVPLPATAPNSYGSGDLVLSSTNGNPTEFKPPERLKDGVSSDPTDASGSRFKAGLDYMVTAYLEHVLPRKQPRLSVLWLRDPDSTQHSYGLGTRNWHDALRATDALLGRIGDKLKQLGLEASTDLIVVSDHGHSNVSGPLDLFPLRAIRDGAAAEVDPKGHSVSGLVRLADLLRRAGFVAFDGLGCSYVPLAAGIKSDGAPVYPVSTDQDGAVCGKAGQKYQVPAMKVPAELPPGALVVAVNGGSDYVYVPDHDPGLVRRAIRFLQGRTEVGALFVDDRYGRIPGTLPLGAIRAANATRNPDILLSYDYDEDAVVNGVRGIEYAGLLQGNSYRGMHGSFSPRDVHNVLIAAGPDFRRGFKDTLPTGNVDLAPTVARVLGLALQGTDGRPLLEAMEGPAPGDYRVESEVVQPDAPATGLTIQLATDPGGRDVDPSKTSYTFQLRTKSLRSGGSKHTYFDSAKAVRR
ncbi:MAG TPA: alkaline phosphatase family protein [Myxococcales bacterium]|nr:alkaline phosphatase family protein [Myxococcales bacterium]